MVFSTLFGLQASGIVLHVANSLAGKVGTEPRWLIAIELKRYVRLIDSWTSAKRI